MPKAEDFAQEIVQICVACFSLAWTPTAIGSLTVRLISLSRLGRAYWSQCPTRATSSAVAEVLAAMQAAGIPESHLAEARAALAALPDSARLDPDLLVLAVKSGQPIAPFLVTQILGQLPPDTSYDARALVETALHAGLRACQSHAEFKATLNQALVFDTARTLGLLQQGQARIEARLDDLPAQLVALLRAQGLAGGASIALDTMQEIAAQFGDAAPGDGPALIRFLTLKAQEYQSYRAQIEAIDARPAGLGALKDQAREAAARLDFARVESLLAEVDAAETAIAAETKRLRADTALLRGRPDEAFAHLSAAADGFAGLDPLEPARARIEDAPRLARHGSRYGGAGLALAARHLRAALALLDPAAQPVLWAAAQNGLSAALSESGARTPGDAGAHLLAEAESAARAALAASPRTLRPEAWASAQTNLATALQARGERLGGTAGAALVDEAFAAYHAALKVRTRKAHPVDWALIQHNLGALLAERGLRAEGPDSASLLAEAIAAYRAALKVRSATAMPTDWAMTQNNLGNALATLSLQGDGDPRKMNAAIAAWRAALTVYTRAEHPMHWGVIMNNLGILLTQRGSRLGGAQGAALIDEGLATWREALEVRTREASPVDWALTRENMAVTEAVRAETAPDPRPHLVAALAHADAALEVFDASGMTFNHQKARSLRDQIATALRTLDP